MIIKQIKLPSQSKDKLSRLKGRTGIQNWNVLCRWALCFSLSEGTINYVEQEGEDLKVDINFEKVGHKRLMAKFAGLEIIK